MKCAPLNIGYLFHVVVPYRRQLIERRQDSRKIVRYF